MTEETAQRLIAALEENTLATNRLIESNKDIAEQMSELGDDLDSHSSSMEELSNSLSTFTQNSNQGF